MPDDMKSSSMQIDQLETELKKVISALEINEISTPFKDQEKMAMVKLLDRRSAVLMPLEHVKGKITNNIIKDRHARLKENYLAQLRAKSDIIVNKSLWQQLNLELLAKQ